MNSQQLSEILGPDTPVETDSTGTVVKTLGDAAREEARKVGMSKGVPEEFAIDCKAITIGPMEIGGVKYAPGSEVRFYDSRKRDRLRRLRAIMVTSDAWMKQPGPATLPPATVETEGTHHGNDTNPSAPAEARPSKEGGGGTRSGTTPRRRVRSSTGGADDLR